VVLGFDRQGWITVFAGLLLALITLLTGCDHVDILGAAFVDLSQQVASPRRDPPAPASMLLTVQCPYIIGLV